MERLKRTGQRDVESLRTSVFNRDFGEEILILKKQKRTRRKESPEVEREKEFRD